jgi:hypothetical protein
MGCTNPKDPVTTLWKQNVSEESSKHQLGNVEPDMSDGINWPVGIEERLKNAECHLKLHGPVPKDIYSRLKQIEDRILYLEGLSPEYFQFWVNINSVLPLFMEWLVWCALFHMINPLNAELNPIYHFLALLGAHPIPH